MELEEKEIKQTVINLDFSQYKNLVLNMNMISSIVFANNIKEYMQNYVDLYAYEPGFFTELIEFWLINHDTTIFDQLVKSNVYYLYESFLSINKNLDKDESSQKINWLKRYLNNCSNNNSEFLKQQFFIRNYGTDDSKLINKIAKRHNITDEFIEVNKEFIYNSIGFDFIVAYAFMISNEEFYQEYYKKLINNDHFYRSINHFIFENTPILMNLENLKRVSFVMNKNNEQIKNNFNIDHSLNNDSIYLRTLSKKLVKTIEKTKKFYTES